MKAAPKLAALALVLVLGCVSGAQAATYTRGDVLYVVYQPRGAEAIFNLGPASRLLGAAAPIGVPQVTAGDLAGIFGSPLPTNLRGALFATPDVDAYVASNGPSSLPKIGSAIGAASQIQSFGGNFAATSTPLAGNPDGGTYTFGSSFNYQKSLDGASVGSLGGNVPFSVETALNRAPTLVNVFFAESNPFTGGNPVQKLVGRLSLQPDGTLSYFPARTIAATCVFNPGTINPQSNGHGFSFDVALMDVTDPQSPTAVDLSRMSPAYVAQAGATILPKPSLSPSCGPAQDGLWENTLFRTPTSIVYNLDSDGVCSTADGDRQDLISAMGNVIDGTDVPVCFQSDVETNPVSCCGLVRVINRGNR